MIATSMRRLEVFLAVAETGRFSQAADRLGIAQPSVSAHIAGLERQIGQSLFVRSPGRPPALSRAGQSLLNYATDVLSKSRETADALKTMRPVDTQELTIAAQRCIANHLLPPLLTDFMNANPEIKISMNSEIQENVVSLITENHADLGLFLGLQRISGMPSEVVGYRDARARRLGRSRTGAAQQRRSRGVAELPVHRRAADLELRETRRHRAAPDGHARPAIRAAAAGRRRAGGRGAPRHRHPVHAVLQRRGRRQGRAC